MKARAAKIRSSLRMVTIEPILAKAAKKFCTEMFSPERLAMAFNRPPRWAGTSPVLRVLPATVTIQQLAGYLEGIDFQEHAKPRFCPHPNWTSGWQFTASAPKTFSILWGLADPERRTELEKCHNAGIASMLRGIDQLEKSATDGSPARCLFAVESSKMSEQGDPELKTRCVLLDLAVSENFDSNVLAKGNGYRSEHQAARSYQMGLLLEARHRFGSAQFEALDGAIELKGVPTKIREEFSQSFLDAPLHSFSAIDELKLYPPEEHFRSWTRRAELHGWGKRETSSFLAAMGDGSANKARLENNTSRVLGSNEGPGKTKAQEHGR